MKDILKRFYELIIKLISSKGLVFITASVALFIGKLNPTYWFFAGVAFISLRSLEKIFRK